MFNDIPQYKAPSDAAWEASSDGQKNKRAKINLKHFRKSQTVELMTLFLMMRYASFSFPLSIHYRSEKSGFMSCSYAPFGMS